VTGEGDRAKNLANRSLLSAKSVVDRPPSPVTEKGIGDEASKGMPLRIHRQAEPL
jgi:hypothetical protein